MGGTADSQGFGSNAGVRRSGGMPPMPSNGYGRPPQPEQNQAQQQP